MNRGKASRKEDISLVELFLRTEPEPGSLLGELPKVREFAHSKVQAIRALEEASIGLWDVNVALEQAQAAYREKSSLELHLGLLVF